MARPRGDIRERVLHAARAVFLAHGVEGASLRDIAAGAKTSIGMVYYYFPTKEALFEAVIEEVYPRFLEGIAEALEPDAPVAARIERLFVRMGRLDDAELDVVRIVLAEVLRSSSQRDLLVRLGMRGHVRLVLGTILEGLAQGELTGDVPPMAIALSIFAPAVFAQVMRRLIGDRAPAELHVPEGEDLAHALARVTLGGIGAAAGARTTRTVAPRATTKGRGAPRPKRAARTSPTKPRAR